MLRRPIAIACVALLTLSWGWPNSAWGQYFGRNKPIYKNIKFNVYETPHFDIYHYLPHDSLLNKLARSSEVWFDRHRRVFGDTLRKQNPILAYSNHADFQQTTTISSDVGVGTGGVTESLKNRIVFPLTETWAQTNHVLGHEMVHAFQYNMLTEHDSLSVNNIQSVPLWMIEGMAEYLSIGSTDYQTAMWVRDALLNDNFPTLRQLTTDMYTYFPYRWGHAFWAFVGKTFGDSLIIPIFRETAMSDYNHALIKHIGMNEEALSGLWKSLVEAHFGAMMPENATEDPPGSKVLFERNAGEANISPSVSPDGRFVAFFSEMDLFSTDLFIAHAVSGKVLHRLSQVVRSSDVDAINFVESAGTWSPDSRYFAFVTFSRGQNRLMLVDTYNDSRQELSIDGVPYFNYPTWSPDGQSIVVSGLVDGISDLYSVDLQTRRTTQLTHDPWCNIHPTWSGDGQTLVFSTDRPSALNSTGKGYSLATLNLHSGEISVLDVFPTADNLNPMFSGNNTDIYFLSNCDGFRNLYKHNIHTGRTFRLTNLFTGISGISPLSPAMSVARENDEICYSHFYNGRYSIYSADTVEFTPIEISPLDVNMAAAILPPYNSATEGIVDAGLRADTAMQVADNFKSIPFRRKFKLDYVSNIGMGMSTGQFGSGLAGGIEMLFSDITGTNMLYAALSLNGEIYDFGGQLSYIKQRKYISWGVTLAHIPMSWGAYGYDTLVANIDGADRVLHDYQLIQYRLFQSSVGLLAQFPISKTQRFELSTGFQRYSYRIDIYSNYYLGNLFYGADRHRNVDAPTPIWLERTSAAYVFDNSDFGIASPMRGQRAWIGVEKAFGDYDYFAVGADWRRYLFLRPTSIAFRAMYRGRFGRSDLLNYLSPLYLAYPWYVRGYNGNLFTAYDPSGVTNIDQMQGDQMALLSLEWRIPFTGPRRLSLISSNMILTELALFTDAGVAWEQNSRPTFAWHPTSHEQHIPFVSSGISLRVNLFGMIVLEPYVAIPYQLGGFRSINWGMNFLPGW